MEYASLIAEFGTRYGIGDLVPDENGAVGISASGQPMSLQLIPETTVVVATIEVSEVPDAGRASVDRVIVQANRSLYLMDGMVLVHHSQDEHYCLVFRIDIAQLDFVGFDEKIAHFLAVADRWRDFLEKFIPLAGEAEEIGTSVEGPEDGTFLADLIQV